MELYYIYYYLLLHTTYSYYYILVTLINLAVAIVWGAVWMIPTWLHTCLCGNLCSTGRLLSLTGERFIYMRFHCTQLEVFFQWTH